MRGPHRRSYCRQLRERQRSFAPPKKCLEFPSGLMFRGILKTLSKAIRTRVVASSTHLNGPTGVIGLLLLHSDREYDSAVEGTPVPCAAVEKTLTVADQCRVGKCPVGGSSGEGMQDGFVAGSIQFIDYSTARIVE